jgi:acyl-CoA synthetase
MRSYDRARALPATVIVAWQSAGLWSESTVTDVLSRDVEPDATACVVNDDRYTFGDLRRWSHTVAHALRARGVACGDRVVIQLSNSAELLASIMGCWHLGAVAVPVLPLFRAHELSSVISQTQPSAVVAAGPRGARSLCVELDIALEAASAAPLVRWAVGRTEPGWSAFPGLAARDVATVPFPGFTDPAACAVILFTSGTTAKPKGVRHDSRSLLAEVNSYRRSAALSDRDVVFNPAPVAHVGALVISLIAPWIVGSPVVLQPRWDPQQAAELVCREKVTFAVGAPVFLEELVTRYESADHRGHRVAKFQTGAAPTSPALVARAADVGVVAWRAWGMTEAPTISYGSVTDPLERRANTDGRVEPGSEVVAVDEHRRPVAAGTEGELLLRSPKQMMGYAEPEDDAVRPDGWLSTGDLGSVDDDGWVQITGRVKEIINRGGEKFSAREIENALSTHPQLDTVAVLGVPHDRLGEQVVAYVTTRAGQAYPGFDALIAHLKQLRIASQKHPVVVTVVDELPVTSTGKLRKAALAQEWRTAHPPRDN